MFNITEKRQKVSDCSFCGTEPLPQLTWTVLSILTRRIIPQACGVLMNHPVRHRPSGPSPTRAIEAEAALLSGGKQNNVRHVTSTASDIYPLVYWPPLAFLIAYNITAKYANQRRVRILQYRPNTWTIRLIGLRNLILFRCHLLLLAMPPGR